MMHVASHRIWLECIVYPLTYRKNALFFTLRSKVDLIWTLAVRPAIAQSVHFNKISKQQNIDLCQFFSHWKEAQFLLKSWNKRGGQRTRFCGRAAESAHQMHFLEMGLGRVSKWHVCERVKKALKNQFLQNLHRDITVRTQCDKDGA